MKILILKPSSLGDVVQAIPVLRLIKRWKPEAQVYWWLQKELIPLLENDPDLAGLIPFDRKKWASPLSWDSLWKNVIEMRRMHFDWVIDLQSLARSGAFAWLANGGFLVGLDDHREGARGFYDIAVPRPSYHTHAVDWYLETLHSLKVPQNKSFVWMPPRPEVAQKAQNSFTLFSSNARWVILVPGARWLTKRWPVAHFTALVEALSHRYPDARFAVLGGKEDCPLGQAIAKSHPGLCLDLTGKSTLQEMVEYIRLSSLVVSNDTGPMHVAAALQCPVVALFGPTEPRRTGPYGQLANSVQPDSPWEPCMKGTCCKVHSGLCIAAISVEKVLARCIGVLSNPHCISANGEWIIGESTAKPR